MSCWFYVYFWPRFTTYVMRKQSLWHAGKCDHSPWNMTVCVIADVTNYPRGYGLHFCFKWWLVTWGCINHLNRIDLFNILAAMCILLIFRGSTNAKKMKVNKHSLFSWFWNLHTLRNKMVYNLSMPVLPFLVKFTILVTRFNKVWLFFPLLWIKC